MTELSDIFEELERAKLLHPWEGYSILDMVAVLGIEIREV